MTTDKITPLSFTEDDWEDLQSACITAIDECWASDEIKIFADLRDRIQDLLDGYYTNGDNDD